MKNKGITLIALIITIIILLILAGISIQALTNQGLFAQAQKANEITKIENAKEQIKIVLTEWQIEKITKGTNLEEFFNKKVAENIIDGFEESEEEGKYNVYKDSYVMVIDTEGNIVEDIQKSGPKPKVSNIKITIDGTTEAADNSQLPNAKLQINFDTSIENGTIKTVTPKIPYTTNGTETEVTFTIVGTVDGTDYRKTIIVEFSEKYKKIEKITSDKLNTVLSTTENITLQDEKGNIITVPAGFKIISDATTNNAQTVDKGIVIEDSKRNQYVWIPCTIEETTSKLQYKRTEWEVESNSETRASKDELTLSGETCSADDITKGLTNEKVAEIVEQVKKEKTSVAKNGGYYIGRYETGNESGSAVIKAEQTPYTDITWSSAYELAKKIGGGPGAQTYLCSSYAWDTAINFIQNTGTENYATTIGFNENWWSQTVVDSSGKKVKEAYNGIKLSTGKTTAKSNIFDMGGNVIEFTTEVIPNTENPLVYRGSNWYLIHGKEAPAGQRSMYGDWNIDQSLGFRATLFLN